MSARQLRFFKHPQPLLERFGVEFFRRVPPGPGVYIMSGESGRVLYVGQSKNLRLRLGTYRNANPDHVPRKIIRLVHAVRKIDWEECATPQLACVRENELLRTHRPKFNSMNTYPLAYCFIGLEGDDAAVTLWITTAETTAPNLYGAFKRRSVQAYAALLRLLWAAFHQPSSVDEFPHRLLSGRPALRYRFSVKEYCSRIDLPQLRTGLENYLAGVSPQLIEILGEHLPSPERLLPFHQNLQSTDLELVSDFYKFGPERNQALRKQHGVPGLHIPQERLDDLLALSRNSEPRQQSRPKVENHS